jgi:hypothetical protein
MARGNGHVLATQEHCNHTDSTGLCRPIRVARTPAPQNVQSPNLAMANPTAAAAAAAAAAASRPPQSNARIYVGSINFDLNEADVRSVFEPFGTIKSCILLVCLLDVACSMM